MFKVEKRFNLKESIKLNVTIRAKILCIISWIFKIHILAPNFEVKAREKEIKKGEYFKRFGKTFEIGMKGR